MIRSPAPAGAADAHICPVSASHLEALKQLYDEKFSSRDRALTVALTAMDRRLDAMNEFRETLRDQASHFLSRDEYMAAHSALVREMDSTRIDLSKYAVHVEEFDKISSVERA